LPAAVHRDLVAYAELLGHITGQPVTAPAKLIVPMVERFMATDRAFAKAKRSGQSALEVDASNEGHATELAKRKFCEAQALHHWSLHADRIQVRAADFPS
jgi:hypothetical protein